MLKPMEELYDRVDEELSDAKHYAWKALSYKTEMPELAKTFSSLAAEELRHAMTLNAEIEKLVKNAPTSADANAMAMREIETFMKKKMNERMVAINSALAQYKGG